MNNKTKIFLIITGTLLLAAFFALCWLGDVSRYRGML